MENAPKTPRPELTPADLAALLALWGAALLNTFVTLHITKMRHLLPREAGRAPAHSPRQSPQGPGTEFPCPAFAEIHRKPAGTAPRILPVFPPAAVDISPGR